MISMLHYWFTRFSNFDKKNVDLHHDIFRAVYWTIHRSFWTPKLLAKRFFREKQMSAKYCQNWTFLLKRVLKSTDREKLILLVSVTSDTWHGTCDTWHMTHLNFHSFFLIFLGEFLLMLLFAHMERISLSWMQNFLLNQPKAD